MKTKCCHTGHMLMLDKHTVCTNSVCENYMNVTTCYKDYSKARKLLMTGVFIFSILFTFDDFSKADKSIEADLIPANTGDNIPVSLKNIEEELKRHEVICYREVIAQIRLESGNLSSYLMRKTNNMLGMRFPFKRATTACGLYLPESDTIIKGTQEELKKYAGTNNYAVYDTWQDAVEDYSLWQESSFRVKEKYLEFLGKYYAEDQAYISKIKDIANRIK